MSRVVRYTFVFSAYVTRDVEVPDGAEENDDAFEAALQREANSICVDDFASWDDAHPAEEDAR